MISGFWHTRNLPDTGMPAYLLKVRVRVRVRVRVGVRVRVSQP